MSRAPPGRHPHPRISLVRQADLQLGRLGDDGAVHLAPVDHAGGAQTRVLLIGDSGQHEIAREFDAAVDQGLHGADTGGQRSLHVVGSASEHPTVADGSGEGVGHSRYPHRIDVGVEHEGSPPPPSPSPPSPSPSPPTPTTALQRCEDADTARLRLDHLHSEAERSQDVADQACDLAFPTTRRIERGIDRVDLDEANQRVANEIGIDRYGHSVWASSRVNS